jgi:uncharacterized protein (DUF58 family)
LVVSAASLVLSLAVCEASLAACFAESAALLAAFLVASAASVAACFVASAAAFASSPTFLVSDLLQATKRQTQGGEKGKFADRPRMSFSGDRITNLCVSLAE